MTRLIVIHYHWRMGGVRRVVEVGVPALVAHEWLRIDEVVFVSGEAADGGWEERMRAQIGDSVPVSFLVEPAFGYVADWGDSAETLRGEVRKAAARVLGEPCQETVAPGSSATIMIISLTRAGTAGPKSRHAGFAQRARRSRQAFPAVRGSGTSPSLDARRTP
jgi:hypothetical protein